VGLVRGPLSLMSTIKELLERKRSGSDLETRDHGRRGSAALTRRHPSIRTNFADKRRRSVGIVRSRTEDTELLYINIYEYMQHIGQNMRRYFHMLLLVKG
jgi:hypothetical protein